MFFFFSKSSDGSVQRFDKSLEEFYALCDQLELCLVRLERNTPNQSSAVRGRGCGTFEKLDFF